MSEWNAFCCPQCRGSLSSNPEAYCCDTCKRNYPIVFGVPDFRLSPDPYISFENEYEKARALADEAARVSFEDLVRFYWDITREVPHRAVERYVRYALTGQERGEACLEAMDAAVACRWTGQACLEIGCGTGGFLLAAQHRFHALVGVDIALRWLIIAKKRLTNATKPVILACCSAERLPFPDATFDTVIGLHTLEHTANQQALLSEAVRTLRAKGLCFFSTANRFSLGPEPCVRVWGVGFFPRSLAEAYVRLIKGIPYRHIRLLSVFELSRLLRRSGLSQWTISPPRIANCEKQAVSRFTRFLITIYHALRECPPFSFGLRILGPFLQVVAQK